MRRIALAGVVLTALLAAFVAVGYAAAGTGKSRPRVRMVAAHAHRDPGAFAKKLGARSLRSALRRQRRLVAPAAVSERSESRRAFANQGEDAAFATLDEAFPAVLKPVPEPIAESDRVLKYVNDDHAAILAPVDEDKANAEERKPRLAMSTLPLRVKNRDGQLAPLSTDVTEPTPGEFRPENALTEIVVNRDLREGIKFPEADVEIRATGINQGQPATVRKDRVFWANVQTDTDLVVSLRPDGVETFDVLRSQQSPELLSYEVDVPEGGSVALDEGRQVVEFKNKDGKTIGYAGPPAAVDADGTQVATQWVVQGTLLQIAVDHRGADVRYPVLVDPPYTVDPLGVDRLSWFDDPSLDFAGWSWTESNPNALVHLAGDAGIGRGLNIYLPGGLTAPANLWGMWEFKAPGDTYVNRFEIAHFSYRPWGNRSCAAAGILKRDNPIEWNSGQVTTPSGNVSSPWGLCPNVSPGFVSNWYMTATLTGGTFTRGNAAAFQWYAPNTASSPTLGDFILLGGAYVEVTDDQQPVDITQFGLPSGWTKNKTLSFSTYATDNGLGMGHMEVVDDGEIVGSQWLVQDEEHPTGCDPDPSASNRCPGMQRVDVSRDFSDGIHDFGVVATDAMGNVPNLGADPDGDPILNPTFFPARVDAMSPGYPELSGPAYDLKGQAVAGASYKVHVWGRDYPSDPLDETMAVSGIGKQELLVDGVVVDSKSQGCDQACLDGDGADLDSDLTFNTSGVSLGLHTLKVDQTDRAGNTMSSNEWTLTVVSGTVTRPSPGAHSSRRATLEAHAVRSGITNVRWEYRTAASGSTPAGAWTTIPVTALRDANGNQPSSTMLPITGSDSAPISWDVKGTPGLGTQSQALDVRGVFDVGTTSPSRLLFDTKGLDARIAGEPIGPGQVNLLTGNFSVTEDDVSISSGLADLRVNRTYNSRDAATAGPLGPGWKFGAPVLDDIDPADRLVEHLSEGYIELTLGDGTPVPFTVGTSLSTLTPAVGYEQYSLELSEFRRTGTGWLRKYTLTDTTSGATIRFDGDPGASTFYPASVREGTASTAVTSVYETVGGVTRAKSILAPATTAMNCTTGTAGCRVLKFSYATTTTATGTLPANWGDYNGQLKSIDFTTYNAAGSAVPDTVASYSYDSTGRLRAEWDPRISPLKTQYSYDANGLLIGLTSPGESAWSMSYAQVGGETERGRLSQVNRTVPAGSATWTMAYNLSLSGTNAPMTMSKSVTDTWGQLDLPTDVTAIFPPDQVPALPTSDYTRASVHYLNRDAFEVNDLEPGGELSTSERDRYGNVVRALSARNRATALAAGASSSARAGELDTRRAYQDNGLNLTDELGPQHSVQLDNGTVVAARRHTVRRYDETKPAGSTTSYHLPTTQIVTAQIAGPSEMDSRTTTTAYDWTLRKPTRVLSTGAAGGLSKDETSQYDASTGLMTGHHLTKSPTTDAASTTKYYYYTADASSPIAVCRNQPEWQWMLCQKGPGAQPGGSLPSLPSTTYQYNRLDQVTSEDRGSRVSTTTYDPAGRETGTSWTNGSGVAVPSTTITYGSATGREATTEAVVNGTLRKIEHVYDSAGQLSQYKDGTGQSTDTTYDLLGRPLTVDDGKGTQTNTYDAITGRLKQIVDSQAGTISATYNADGDIETKTLPNGLKATYQYDEAGNAVDLAWVKTTGCSSSCTWLHFDAKYSVFDQMRAVNGPSSAQQFSYDAVGRLTLVRDTPTGQGCTTRRYSFDGDSNRTQIQTYAPGGGGACSTSSTSTLENHSYDAADRLVDSGYVYDAQGRITTAPVDASDGTLISTYFEDDRVRSQRQGDVTNTYDLDPARRSMVRSRVSAEGTETETSHYSDDSDSPSWTATDTGHWSRSVGGVDGDLVATVDDSSKTVLQLTDLHGNVAATAATSSTKVADTQVLQPVRSGSGWSLDPTRPLPSGGYIATVRQNDASGNVGSATTRFTVGADASPDLSYRTVVMADFPEAYWRLGESNGTTTAEDERLTHDGTYGGGVAPGRPGAVIGDTNTSARFDGVDDGVQAFDQPSRSVNGFSVEAFVKTGQRGGTIMSQGGSSDSNHWKIRVEDTAGSNQGKIQAIYHAGQRTASGYSSIRVDDRKWHHVEASFAPFPGTARITVDGVAASGSNSIATGAPLYAFGFDEASGSTANNTGAGGALWNGTITGATRTTSGRFGGALNFSSVSTYVEVPEPGNAGTAKTIEAWVKPTTNATGMVVGKSSVFQMGTKLNAGLNPFASVGTQNSSATTPTLPLNTWSHVAMTWDKATATMKVYANAQLVQTLTSVPDPPAGLGTPWRIGAMGTGFFTGTIDEVKIYPRALTQAEIVVDQNVPARTETTSYPSAAFGLDSALGNVLTDSSGNNRNVTLSGTAGSTIGQFGNGIAFNSTNYGSFTDPSMASTPTNGSTGVTLSSWIKTSGQQSVPFLGGTSFGLYGSKAVTLGPGVCMSTTCLYAQIPTIGVWTHITATYDRPANKLSLYVNGALFNSTTVSPSVSALPGGVVGIGRDTVGGQAAFASGTVDEIRAYPRPLSAAEVAREWNMSVFQNPGGADPKVTIGNGGAIEYFAGQIDEPATYPRVLTDDEAAEHSRIGSPSNTMIAPSLTGPGTTVADSTPVYSGNGQSVQMSPSLRVDVFSGTDLTANPVQSLLASRPLTSWSGESAKGLPAGTYTAKITQNDLSGRYGTATRTFTIAGAADPETGYATSVRSDTPRAYWRLGETSGTTAADDLTAHPATYTGSPTLGSTGALITDTNKAPTLDGVNDRADSPNTSGYFDPGTGNFSIEGWAKTTANGNEVIATKGTNWQLAVTSDTGNVGKAKFTYANGAITAYSSGRVDDGTWHHIVAVANRASGATIYVDGIAGTTTATANSTPLTDTNPVRIGAHATTAGYFTGQLDEIAVYNTALSAARILAHYRLSTQLDSTAPAPTITAPADGSSTTNAALNFTGTAGIASTDAAALSLSIAPDPTAGPLSVFDYDEFGTPRSPTQASRYGYLGGKQRSAELPSGVIAMGERSYIPTLGRFLQVDPVDGGSANPYDYTNQDPLNQFDLTGRATAGGRCIEGRPGFNRRRCEAAGFKITPKGKKYPNTSRLQKACMMASGASILGAAKTILTKVGGKVVMTMTVKKKAGAFATVIGIINCDF